MPALEETRDCWILPLGGMLVASFVIDYAFAVEFAPEAGEPLTLRIEAPFTLSRGDRSRTFSPGANPTGLGPALHLFRKKVEQAMAWKGGRLDVGFVDGIELRVGPDPQFGAWQLSDSRGLLIGAAPGGGLSLWRTA
jgi:hypothetical protein